MRRYHLKTLAAPASVTLCAIVIVAAFFQYYGQVYYPPPILNTKFKYWSSDPITNASKPYAWLLDYIKGPGDLMSTFPITVQGRNALGIQVFQDGANDTFDWATVHVRQELRGQALRLVFNAKIRIWVHPTFSFIYDQKTGHPRNMFGIEINDGTHLLWFVFTNEKGRAYMLPNHRIVIVETPLDTWSLREVNISGEYAKAGWQEPVSLSFILVLGSTKIIPGFFYGYFGEIEIPLPSGGQLERASLITGTLKSSLEAASQILVRLNWLAALNT